MLSFLGRPVILLALACLVPTVRSQEPPVPAASEVQAKLRQWVETRKAISAEKAEWEAEKATLAELNAVRERETDQLEDFVEAAGERVDELATQRGKFKEEEAELKTWRRRLEQRVEEFETRLRPLAGQFPPPLREQVEEALIRIESADPGVPLQNRARDVLLATKAWLEFHGSITVDSELREIDGKKREIDVLYLGMTRAFYVDKSGRHGGYGAPSGDGWQWTEDPSLASRVRLAIDVHARSETPRFVSLPVPGAPSSPE
ncbi:MAG: DUF3450 family protein [Verrucomicrobiales bacterium]